MGVVGAEGGRGVAAEQTREGNATRERERGEWEAEIIVEITYEARLRAGETRGNRIEGEEDAKEDARARAASLSSRLFNYLSRSRTPLSFVAREWDGDAISRITAGAVRDCE